MSFGKNGSFVNNGQFNNGQFKGICHFNWDARQNPRFRSETKGAGFWIESDLANSKPRHNCRYITILIASFGSPLQSEKFRKMAKSSFKNWKLATELTNCYNKSNETELTPQYFAIWLPKCLREIVAYNCKSYTIACSFSFLLLSWAYRQIFPKKTEWCKSVPIINPYRKSSEKTIDFFLAVYISHRHQKISWKREYQIFQNLSAQSRVSWKGSENSVWNGKP